MIPDTITTQNFKTCHIIKFFINISLTLILFKNTTDKKISKVLLTVVLIVILNSILMMFQYNKLLTSVN